VCLFLCVLSSAGVLSVAYKTGFGLDDWIYCTLYIHTTRDYRQCSAIADLHTLQFTVTHALGFSVFTSRILATGCHFKSHMESFLQPNSFLAIILQLPVPKARLDSTRRAPAALCLPQKSSWYSFLLRGLVYPRAIVRLEGLGQLKNSNDLIGNRTHDFPACSIMPEATTLPRAPRIFYLYII
jgi:hypothetical protein